MFATWIEEDRRFAFSIAQNADGTAVEITPEYHAELLSGIPNKQRIVPDKTGRPVLADPLPPTIEQIIAEYESSLDRHLDAVAKSCRYDNRFTFALRAGFPGPYHDEAVKFAGWMDACNVQAFALLESVVAGQAELPTVEAFISALPVFDPLA